MDRKKVVEILTLDQALAVVRTLVQRGGPVAQSILEEAVKLLSFVDIESVAQDVYILLDSIDVQDCWDRTGKKRNGYVSEDDAAADLIEEVLEPFLSQINDYHRSEMHEQERTYVQAVLLGLYLFERESGSEFKDWCIDMPFAYADRILDSWKRRHADDTAAAKALMDFLAQRCADWEFSPQ